MIRGNGQRHLKRVLESRLVPARESLAGMRRLKIAERVGRTIDLHLVEGDRLQVVVVGEVDVELVAPGL